MTLSALLYAGVEVGVIEAFGMKMPEHLVERMAEIQCHLEERVDILATCGGILVYHFSAP